MEVPAVPGTLVAGGTPRPPLNAPDGMGAGQAESSEVAARLFAPTRWPPPPMGGICVARLRYRERQVARSKERLEYRLYGQSLPLEDRTDGHPVTPDAAPETPFAFGGRPSDDGE